MRGTELQDRVQRAVGRAAMAVGDWCEAFRPVGAGPALDPVNRFMLLKASFSLPHEGYAGTAAYGSAAWVGMFDAGYTSPGDYLVRPDAAVWFVASQPPLMPVLCVRTNRVVGVSRPAELRPLGVNGYGGVGHALEQVLDRWPASVLTVRGVGMRGVELPSDVAAGSWQVLLPASCTAVLRHDDVLTDDLGRTGVVAAAELSELGWRLLVRQATV